MIDSKLSRALATFLRASDAVREVLGATTDWGASGQREGQYSVDLAADAVCLDVLFGAGYRVLSEESGVTTPPGVSSAAPIVVVDPVDGSTNASRHVPWYASALCLVDDEGPAAAVVVNHATGDVFTATRAGGAEHNGGPCRPSGATELAGAIMGVSGLPSHHYGWAQYPGPRCFGARHLRGCLWSHRRVVRHAR